MATNERKIATRLTLDGEAAFKKSLDETYRGLKVLGSEMKLNTAIFGKNEESVEGLTQKGNILTREIAKQKEAVALLSDAVEKNAALGEKNSKLTDEYRIKLNKATAVLYDMERELKANDDAIENFGKEEKEADTHTDKLGKSIDTASDKTGKWKDRLEALSSHLKSGFVTVAKGAVIGIAAVGTAALATAAALGRMFTSAVNNADSIQKTADIYGMTAERVQELTYAGTKLDVELDTITGAQTKLTRAMAAAATGKSGPNAQAKAFKTLGISVRDNNGNLRDAKDVMAEAFDALGKVGNETERDALAMTIFGKSAMELNPLIKAGGDELNRLSDEAHKAGAVLSNEAIKGLDDFGDSAEAVKLGLKGVAGTLASEMLPAMGGLLTFVQNLIPELKNAVKTGDFAGLGQMLGDGISELVTKISIGAEKFMPVVTSILTSLITTVVTVMPTVLPVLLDSAMSLFQSVLNVITANVVPLSNMVVSLITSLAGFIITNLPLVLSAGMEILTSILAGIASDPEAVTKGITDLITGLVNVFLNPDNAATLLTSGIEILLAIMKGIAAAVGDPEFPKKITAVAAAIVAKLKENWPAIKQAGIELATKLWEGFMGYFSWDVVGNVKNNIGILFETLGLNAPKGWIRNKGYATGLDTVPTEGLYHLHPDEAVLNAKAAKLWRAGQKGDFVAADAQGYAENHEDSMQQFEKSIVERINSFLSIMEDAGKQAVLAIKDIGKQLLAALADGMEKCTTAVIDKVDALCSKMTSYYDGLSSIGTGTQPESTEQTTYPDTTQTPSSSSASTNKSKKKKTPASTAIDVSSIHIIDLMKDTEEVSLNLASLSRAAKAVSKIKLIIDGKSYASGLDTVPANGSYNLHANEAVLNAKAAQAWRAEQSGMLSGGGSIDYDRLGAAIANAMPNSSGDVYLDGKKVGYQTAKYVSDALGQSAKSLIRSGFNANLSGNLA